jgi:RHS repeat-associated protein
VEKQGSAAEDTIYFGGAPIARYAGGGWTDLIYGPTGLLAEVPGNAAGQPVYRVTDNLGTTVGSLLANGTFVDPIDHAPFGQVFTGSTNDPYFFTGLERDGESGLDHAQFRQYASTMGRWMSPDPYDGSMDLSNPQSLNRYSYVSNMPMNFTDPTGLFGEELYTIIGTPLIGCGASCAGLADILSGPVGWIIGGIEAGFELAHVFGWGAHPKLQAATKARPNAPNNFTKHYGLTTPCGSSASQVMGAVEGNFANFGNYSRWGGAESVTFSPPAGMGPGSTIPINVGIFGVNQSLSVNVQSMNSQSMTFTTNPGHLIYPGSITFAASPASPGSINFNINLGGTVTSPAEFNFGGSAFEDAQWNHFLGQVSGFCKVGG